MDNPIDIKIKHIINHFNLNNYAFSKRIGVTGTTIDSIVNGRPQADGTRKKTKPGYDVLAAIINAFDINPDYLFGKSKIMLKTDIKNSQTYSGIPQVISVGQDEQENIVFVPVKARAGYLDGYGDPDFIETLPTFRIPHLQNGSYRCFEVKGNSMANTFFDNNLVFGDYVEDLNTIKDGKVYVIVTKNDGVVLKRVYNTTKNRITLKSDNQDGNYPDIVLDTEDIVEIWYVTMFASKDIPEPIGVYHKLQALENHLLALKQKNENK
ncbi:XRE family transcriptional regulator [Lacinutrix chionoecetis]